MHPCVIHGNFNLYMQPQRNDDDDDDDFLILSNVRKQKRKKKIKGDYFYFIFETQSHVRYIFNSDHYTELTFQMKKLAEFQLINRMSVLKTLIKTKVALHIYQH